MVVSMEEADLQRIADAVIRALWPMVEALVAKTQSTREIRAVPPPAQASATRPLGTVVRESELRLLTGLSKSTIRRMEKKGEFPARRQLSNGRVGWRRDEVDEWSASRQRA